MDYRGLIGLMSGSAGGGAPVAPLFGGPSYSDMGLQGAGTGNVTPSLPLTLHANDILVLFCETANEAVTAPAGFTQAGSSPASNGGASPTRLTVFWKRATGVGEADFPTVLDPGDHIVCRMFNFHNCVESGNPFNVTGSNSGSSGASVSIPGATTTLNNCLVIAAFATTDNTGSVTNFSGWTNADLVNVLERWDITRAEGGGAGFATGEKQAAGAYGATTVTQAQAVEWAPWTGALLPAVTPLPFVAHVAALSGGTGDVTPALPNYQENDILVLFVETNNEAVTAPTGYTQAGSSPASNAGAAPTRLTVFWKRATASESAPTVLDPGDHAAAQIMAVRGCIATGDPWDVTASSGGGTATTISIGGVTTSVNNCLIIAAFGSTRDSFSGPVNLQSDWANANLTNFGQDINAGTSQGTGGGFGVGSGVLPAAGASGATATKQITNVQYTTWTGALKPA